MTEEKAINIRLIQKTYEIICSVSSKENLMLFQMASTGFKYNSSLLERLGISRKQYYKGLRALKDAGLIRKFESKYFHTTLGRLIYHELLKIEKYTRYLNEMKIIDVLKDSGEFNHNEMSDFIKKMSDKTQDLSLSDIAIEI
jgi:DNA-binding HxlR family transcriptional regulator